MIRSNNKGGAVTAVTNTPMPDNGAPTLEAFAKNL